METVKYQKPKPANYKYDFKSMKVNESFEVTKEGANSVRNASIQYVKALKKKKVLKSELPKFSTIPCEDGKYRCFRIK